jgi:type I site-specific restriction-modification system R (restriction) subunit
MTTTESQIEQDLIAKLEALKYDYRPEICDRASLEANFREKFQKLNRVSLSNSEFERLKDDLVTADVFAASRRLREINSFERDDGTPLFYTLVNIKDWCKNTFQAGCVEENTYTETLVRRLLSTDYADKVIVTTIQKLGIALDGTHKRKYKERLEPLRNKRVVFIFDECHRSQFGDNHKAIKDFFPNAQLFGFTGTPIFGDNASKVKVQDQQATGITTEDVFQKQLHAYTITHAIEDRNVLQFHVDYFKADGKDKDKATGELKQQAVVDTILAKHDTATAGRKFNALLACASINHAIAYHELFKETQARRLAANPSFRPLNIACVFSPPAEGDKDVQRLKTKLDQYTDLTEADQANIAAVMPEDQLKAFRGAYLETARRLKALQNAGQQDRSSLTGNTSPLDRLPPRP